MLVSSEKAHFTVNVFKVQMCMIMKEPKSRVLLHLTASHNLIRSPTAGTKHDQKLVRTLVSPCKACFFFFTVNIPQLLVIHLILFLLISYFNQKKCIYSGILAFSFFFF